MSPDLENITQAADNAKALLANICNLLTSQNTLLRGIASSIVGPATDLAESLDELGRRIKKEEVSL